MKVRHKGERLEIEVEGSDVKECMTELAAALEVFGNSVCGACDSQRTVPTVREVQGVTYYEMKCLDCNSSLGFGQTKVGHRLFPRRKDKSDAYLPGNGWTKWSPKATAADEAF
jgi:hypothetical protein